MPEVALVEFPPKKPVEVLDDSRRNILLQHTLLIQNNDIATGQVDGMRSAEAGHCSDVSNQLSGVMEDGTLTSTTNNNNSGCHFELCVREM